MAKKKKNQKAGMVKRKQQKRIKKANSRRKLASRPQQMGNMSEKNAQKILKNIPQLAFEPPLLAINYPQEVIQNAGDTPIPVVIQESITEEFQQELQEKLIEMDLESSPQTPHGLMVKALLYSIGEGAMPVFMNPLIVAIYLKTKANLEGQALDRLSILNAVEEYEKQHVDLIQSMMEAETDSTTEEDANIVDAEIIEPEADDLVLEDSPEILSQEIIESWKASISSLDEEQQERMIEDLEVFVEDYLTIPKEQWSKSTIRKFLGTWFEETVNPTEEDRMSIRETLKNFLEFMKSENHLVDTVVDEMLSVIENQSKE